MTPRQRERGGAVGVLLVSAVVVIAALAVRLILSNGAEFIAGVLVGAPLGALLGWLADQLIPVAVDRYLARIRGR